MSDRVFAWTAGALLLSALLLRFIELEARPMHGDEAVHAAKFAGLLEKGHYRYDPYEYHGPTLNYLTLLPAWLAGAKNYTALDENILRSVPALLGVGVVALLLFMPGLPRPVAVASAALAALSPFLTLYSRYYIQETLLVFFALLLLWAMARLAQRPGTAAALVAGIAAGCMAATKETFVLLVLAGALAWLIAAPGRISKGQIAILLVTAASVAALFFSSFLSHPRGIIDAVLAVTTYSSRAVDSVHLQPFSYYFTLLFRPKPVGPVLLTEVAVALAALIGAWQAWRNAAAWPRFWALFALLLAVIFSIIPYKTPWNALSFYTAALVPAGYGLVWLLRQMHRRWLNIMLLAIVFLPLIAQNAAVNFSAQLRSHNPYLYAHPGEDVVRMAAAVNRAANSSPAGDSLYVQVIAGGADYWPLPWYLRRYQRVGWWSQVDSSTAPAPVILISADLREALAQRLYEQPPPGERPLYLDLFGGPLLLRPDREMYGYVRSDLWQAMQQEEAR